MKVIQPDIQVLSTLNGGQMLMDIQRAAKTCYQTQKMTDDVESAKRIIKMLIDSGHHSMLEFGNVTMKYISNIAAYKDLRTHRHSTFAVESTRWCAYDRGRFSKEIKFLDPIEIPHDTLQYEVWLNGCKQAEENYMRMASFGATADQLSLLLPQSTAAEFCVTANLREWRHILNLRSSIAQTGHARPCIKQIMDPTLELFHKEIPVVFDDLWEQYQAKKAEQAKAVVDNQNQK